MTIRFATTLLGCALLASSLLPAQAQQAQTLDDVKDLPSWVVELSNLPRDKRERYIRNFNFAKEAYKNSKWLECIGYLNSCELIFNQNPNVWNLLAGAYIEQEQYDEAERVCLKSLKDEPANSVVQLNLSSIYLAQGKFQKGYDEIAKVLNSLNPKKEPDLYNVLLYRQFLCLVMMDKQQEARSLVRHTRPMDDTPLYYFTQSTLYILAKDRIKAKGELDSADRIFKNYPLLRAYHKGMMLSGVIDHYINNKD